MEHYDVVLPAEPATESGAGAQVGSNTGVTREAAQEQERRLEATHTDSQPGQGQQRVHRTSHLGPTHAHVVMTLIVGGQPGGTDQCHGLGCPYPLDGRTGLPDQGCQEYKV